MKQRAIGIMSGTSADGIDVVLLECGDIAVPHAPEVVAHAYLPYSADLRRQLSRPLALTATELGRLHFSLAERYAEACQLLPGWQTATCAGLHGQTIVHEVGNNAPATPCTLQIGSSAVVAARLGLPVVGDLRAADVAQGGNGAPLVPFAHWFFLAGSPGGALVVNFGGICNVTLATRELGGVRGTDVGPGMMLADAWAQRASDGRLDCDLDGQLSAPGQLLEPLHRALLDHPFVAQPPPKAAGREQFGEGFFQPLFAQFARANKHDVAYTLLHATVCILAQQLTHAPFVGQQVGNIVLTGGGARNPTLVRLCKQLLSPGCDGATFEVPLSGPLAPQHHEPATMALLALRCWHNLPASLPEVTGAHSEAVLGHIHRPPRPLRVTS